MQSNEGNDEKVFVIEMCTDTHFSTRYDPAKYLDYFNKGKSRNLVSRIALSSRQGRGGGPDAPLLKRSLFILLTCLTFPSFLASLLRHRGDHPGRSRHEKPDSKVVPALRPVLQPDSERGSGTAYLPLGAAVGRLRSVSPGSRKYTTRACARALQ